MTLQLAKPDSQSIFMSINSWADGWSPAISLIKYTSQVVMRFTLSPEHHSADGGSRHSRGIPSSLEKGLLHLSIMQPAGMDLEAVCHRLRAVFKNTNKNYLAPSNGSFSLNLHKYLSRFEECAFNLYFQYIWNWKIQLYLKLQKDAKVLASMSPYSQAWDFLWEYMRVNIFV